MSNSINTKPSFLTNPLTNGFTDSSSSSSSNQKSSTLDSSTSCSSSSSYANNLAIAWKDRSIKDFCNDVLFHKTFTRDKTYKRRAELIKTMEIYSTDYNNINAIYGNYNNKLKDLYSSYPEGLEATAEHEKLIQEVLLHRAAAAESLLDPASKLAEKTDQKHIEYYDKKSVLDSKGKSNFKLLHPIFEEVPEFVEQIKADTKQQLSDSRLNQSFAEELVAYKLACEKFHHLAASIHDANTPQKEKTSFLEKLALVKEDLDSRHEKIVASSSHLRSIINIDFDQVKDNQGVKFTETLFYTQLPTPYSLKDINKLCKQKSLTQNHRNDAILLFKNQLIQQGRFGDAMQLGREWISSTETNTDWQQITNMGYLFLHAAHQEGNDPVGFNDALTSWIKNRPDLDWTNSDSEGCSELAILQGLFYKFNKQFDLAAKNCYEACRKFQPEEPEWVKNIATSHISVLRWRDAEQCIEELPSSDSVKNRDSIKTAIATSQYTAAVFAMNAANLALDSLSNSLPRSWQLSRLSLGTRAIIKIILEPAVRDSWLPHIAWKFQSELQTALGNQKKSSSRKANLGFAIANLANHVLPNTKQWLNPILSPLQDTYTIANLVYNFSFKFSAIPNTIALGIATSSLFDSSKFLHNSRPLTPTWLAVKGAVHSLSPFQRTYTFLDDDTARSLAGRVIENICNVGGSLLVRRIATTLLISRLATPIFAIPVIITSSRRFYFDQTINVILTAEDLRSRGSPNLAKAYLRETKDWRTSKKDLIDSYLSCMDGLQLIPTLDASQAAELDPWIPKINDTIRVVQSCGDYPTLLIQLQLSKIKGYLNTAQYQEIKKLFLESDFNPNTIPYFIPLILIKAEMANDLPSIATREEKTKGYLTSILEALPSQLAKYKELIDAYPACLEALYAIPNLLASQVEEMNQWSLKIDPALSHFKKAEEFSGFVVRLQGAKLQGFWRTNQQSKIEEILAESNLNPQIIPLFVTYLLDQAEIFYTQSQAINPASLETKFLSEIAKKFPVLMKPYENLIKNYENHIKLPPPNQTSEAKISSIDAVLLSLNTKDVFPKLYSKLQRHKLIEYANKNDPVNVGIILKQENPPSTLHASFESYLMTQTENADPAKNFFSVWTDHQVKYIKSETDRQANQSFFRRAIAEPQSIDRDERENIFQQIPLIERYKKYLTHRNDPSVSIPERIKIIDDVLTILKSKSHLQTQYFRLQSEYFHLHFEKITPLLNENKYTELNNFLKNVQDKRIHAWTSCKLIDKATTENQQNPEISLLEAHLQLDHLAYRDFIQEFATYSTRIKSENLSSENEIQLIDQVLDLAQPKEDFHSTYLQLQLKKIILSFNDDVFLTKQLLDAEEPDSKIHMQFVDYLIDKAENLNKISNASTAKEFLLRARTTLGPSLKYNEQIEKHEDYISQSAIAEIQCEKINYFLAEKKYVELNDFLKSVENKKIHAWINCKLINIAMTENQKNPAAFLLEVKLQLNHLSYQDLIQKFTTYFTLIDSENHLREDEIQLIDQISNLGQPKEDFHSIHSYLRLRKIILSFIHDAILTKQLLDAEDPDSKVHLQFVDYLIDKAENLEKTSSASTAKDFLLRAKATLGPSLKYNEQIEKYEAHISQKAIVELQDEKITSLLNENKYAELNDFLKSVQNKKIHAWINCKLINKAMTENQQNPASFLQKAHLQLNHLAYQDFIQKFATYFTLIDSEKLSNEDKIQLIDQISNLAQPKEDFHSIHSYLQLRKIILSFIHDALLTKQLLDAEEPDSKVHVQFVDYLIDKAENLEKTSSASTAKDFLLRAKATLGPSLKYSEQIEKYEAHISQKAIVELQDEKITSLLNENKYAELNDFLKSVQNKKIHAWINCKLINKAMTENQQNPASFLQKAHLQLNHLAYQDLIQKFATYFTLIDSEKLSSEDKIQLIDQIFNLAQPKEDFHSIHSYLRLRKIILSFIHDTLLTKQLLDAEEPDSKVHVKFAAYLIAEAENLSRISTASKAKDFLLRSKDILGSSLKYNKLIEKYGDYISRSAKTKAIEKAIGKNPHSASADAESQLNEEIKLIDELASEAKSLGIKHSNLKREITRLYHQIAEINLANKNFKACRKAIQKGEAVIPKAAQNPFAQISNLLKMRHYE